LRLVPVAYSPVRLWLLHQLHWWRPSPAACSDPILPTTRKHQMPQHSTCTHLCVEGDECACVAPANTPLHDAGDPC
jgi:hypothetical protein